MSTHGEGDPPDQAIQFYEFLHSKRAPKLEHLQYSVLALGIAPMNFSVRQVRTSMSNLQN